MFPDISSIFRIFRKFYRISFTFFSRSLRAIIIW